MVTLLGYSWHFRAVRAALNFINSDLRAGKLGVSPHARARIHAVVPDPGNDAGVMRDLWQGLRCKITLPVAGQKTLCHQRPPLDRPRLLVAAKRPDCANRDSVVDS